MTDGSGRRRRILLVLQYYRPHRTGLTLHVQHLAEEMAARGHHVTVMCARHDRALPRRSIENGVHVVRLWAPLRVSRGMVMPGYAVELWKQLDRCDVVGVHTPMLETGLVGVLATWRRVGMTITHHGDLVLPPGRAARAIEAIVLAFHRVGVRRAAAMIAYSDDYLTHSRYLDASAGNNRVIAPPVIIPVPEPHHSGQLRASLAPEGGPLLLFAGRFVREKRPDLAILALAEVQRRHPNARLVFVGEHEIAYENTWHDHRELVRRHADALTFLGLVDDAQYLADLYAAADVLVLTSDTECFGLVQAEAMLCGTPVVMTDVVGGRVPVTETGMGRLATAGDAGSIASAVLDVLEHRDDLVLERRDVASRLDLDETMDRYERAFHDAADHEGSAMTRSVNGPDEATMARLTRHEPDIAFRRRVRTIMEWIPPTPGTVVLDVPCGRGFHLHRYRDVDEHCTVIGAELEFDVAMIAHDNVGPLGVPVLAAAIESLPFRTDAFDAAIVSEVLEHVGDDVAALREVSRVVRPGGLIAITVPHADYPFLWDPVNRALERATGRHVSTGPLAGIWANHVRLYTPDELRRAVLDAGLEVCEERSFTHHCLPFSHNLVYGIGRPLLERGLLPSSMKRAADRHEFDDAPRSNLNPVTAATNVAGWFDRRNRPTERPGVTTVNLALLARNP
ncbi:MAG: glycosyltransferase [Ilumatobacter sp.]|uniref:glycosyltransferase n=1 Tax=Ilumatobacter sp. TaxID=1967498 RepID=UPI003297D68B